MLAIKKGGTMRKFVIPVALVLTFAVILGTVACGGGEEEPTPTPTPTDEELIQELLDEQVAALNELDWETVYNQRSPSFQSRVTLQEFEAFFEMAYADIIPSVESGEAEVVITDLEISVEGQYGYMTGNLGLDGTVILPFTDEAPDIWQKIDGQWYNLETNPDFPGYDPSELPD
jgi:hypothetical protein